MFTDSKCKGQVPCHPQQEDSQTGAHAHIHTATYGFTTVNQCTSGERII